MARELSQIWHETDVRAILGSVRAPSLLLTEPDPSYVEEATYVASLLPDARVEVHDLFAEPGQAAELIRRFTGAEPSVVSMDSVLATVLFTDIVGSTEKQSSLEIATGRTSSGATTRSCERAGAMAWGRERHGGRRVLRDLRRTGTRHPLLA